MIVAASYPTLLRFSFRHQKSSRLRAVQIKPKPAQVGYGHNYLIDVENAVILDVEAAPARLST